MFAWANQIQWNNDNPNLKEDFSRLMIDLLRIHPFREGNGRIGRIIIPLFMMQAGQLPSPIFFVSEELEKQRAKYYHLLNKTRGDKPDWYSWIEFFVDASGRMVMKLNNLLDHANTLAEEGIAKCTSHTERYIYTNIQYPEHHCY